jgi:hypothetical protein
MTEFLKTILTGQFEAALCMLDECIAACPPEHWAGKIANNTFGEVAYHTLFFVDVYLTPTQEAFELRDLHHRGGDERLDAVSAGLSKDETREYVAICRRKAVEALAAETAESLQGPSGFGRLTFSRGELHLHNLRHVQHHTGQLSAYLRRVVTNGTWGWVRSGWR